MAANGGRAAEEEAPPLGAGSSDESVSTLPAEPTHITRVESATSSEGGEDTARSDPPPKRPGNEEPLPVMEEDLPSDGRDEEGEAMIRDLPATVERGNPPAEK